MINIGIIGDFIAREEYTNHVDWELAMLKTTIKIEHFLYDYLGEINDKEINLICETDNNFMNTIVEYFRKYSTVYGFDVKVTLIARNKCAIRTDIGSPSKMKVRYDDIIFTDKQKTLYIGSQYTIKGKEANKLQYLVDSSDVMIHLWHGDLKEFNNYTCMIKCRNKTRFIIDAHTLDIVEVS